MARMTTNTQGTQPIIVLNTGTAPNLTVPFLQDVTITNSTGIYSYSTFGDTAMQKLTTMSDNEISTNIVIDDVAFFGNSSATANSAANEGIAKLSEKKIRCSFTIWWAGNSAASTDYITTGNCYISGLASTTSPDAPVWVTPITLAVDGSMTSTATG
jgi:hypothetical protein